MRAAQHPDRGNTLLEVLIAMILLGTVVSAVLVATRVMIQSSAFSDEQAGVEAVLGGAADQLGGVTLIPCPDVSGLNSYEQFAQAGAASVGWEPSTVQIESVKFWDPDVGDWSSTNGIGDEDCDGLVFLSTAKAMQLVRVRATAAESGYSRAIDVVISDVRNRGN